MTKAEEIRKTDHVSTGKENKEEYLQTGFAEGFTEGLSEGLSEGFESGFAEGYATGFATALVAEERRRIAQNMAALGIKTLDIARLMDISFGEAVACLEEEEKAEEIVEEIA